MTDTNEGKKPVSPQRFSWKSVGTYSTYAEASTKKNSLKDTNIKIRRCGDNGSLFSVKVGTPVKAKAPQPEGGEE